jgi:hypothetical protein
MRIDMLKSCSQPRSRLIPLDFDICKRTEGTDMRDWEVIGDYWRVTKVAKRWVTFLLIATPSEHTVVSLHSMTLVQQGCVPQNG